VKFVHLVGFIIKKFVTMHGHMNVKLSPCFIRHCAMRAYGGVQVQLLAFITSTLSSHSGRRFPREGSSKRPWRMRLGGHSSRSESFRALSSA